MNVCVCVLYNWSIHMQRLLQCNFNQPGTGVGSPATESQHVQAAEGNKTAVSAQEHQGKIGRVLSSFVGLYVHRNHRTY